MIFQLRLALVLRTCAAPRQIAVVMLGLVLAACGPEPLPTLIPTATVTPAPLVAAQPTRTPQTVISPTPTITPSAIPPTPTPTRTTAPPTPIPRATNAVYVGPSTNERDIMAYRYGTGDTIILLVGGIHGGWEANTVTLMEALRAHFAENPSDIAPGYAVMIVPSLNPDGLAVGQDIAGRFNGAGVDLNRNWACGWEPEAVWREGPVDPGDRPFSEIETRAMAAFIQQTTPAAVLFYHSAASGVFAGDCPRRTGPNRSRELSAVYGDAAGYTYGAPFSAYPVTGTAPSWVDGLGIPAADVELSSSSDPQTERNLRAVLAVQCWLQGPLCTD